LLVAVSAEISTQAIDFYAVVSSSMAKNSARTFPFKDPRKHFYLGERGSMKVPSTATMSSLVTEDLTSRHL